MPRQTSCGTLVYLTREIVRDDEGDFDVGYRRHVALLRLAKVVQDQLVLDGDAAMLVAAGMLGGLCDA